MLHYYAKDFFSPILVSPRLQPTREIDVFLINDNITNIVNATLIIDTFKWSSLEPISTQSKLVSVKELSVGKIPSGIIIPTNETQTEIFYRFSLKDGNSEHMSPYNHIFPVPIKNIAGYKQPHIEVVSNNIVLSLVLISLNH